MTYKPRKSSEDIFYELHGGKGSRLIFALVQLPGKARAFFAKEKARHVLERAGQPYDTELKI